ncbi:MAG TPA: AMP-binding protein, partial [Humisphaera sp.]
MPVRLIEQLDRHAAGRAGAPAVSHAAGVAGPGDLTWAGLHGRVLAFSASLAAVLPAGAVLILCLPNRAEFTVAFLAALRAGLRAFPVSPSLTPAELATATAAANAA